MDFDQARWKDQVHRWWREHAPDLAGVARDIGVKGSYALLTASAFMPLMAEAGGDPEALTTALVGMLGGLGGNLLANIVQGVWDKAAVRRLADRFSDDEVRGALDELIDRAGAIDVASETLGDKWEAFADEVLAEVQKLGGPQHTSIVIKRIRDVYGAVNVAGGDVTTADHGGIAVKDGDLTIHGPTPDDILRLFEGFFEIVRRHGSLIEGQPLRDSVSVTEGSECVSVTREALESAPPPKDRKEWLERQTLREAFKKWETHFVPLAGAERLPVDVAIVRIEGEGPQQQRVRETIPDVRDAFERHERFVLLGDPGGGKTTVLQKLALEGFQAAVRDKDARVPFFVELSRHKQGTPDAFLKEQWEKQKYHEGLGQTLQDALKSKQLLILADGLNELPREHLKEQMEAWREWVQDVNCCPPGNRVVFACRTLDYAHPLELPQVEVLPLSEGRVQEFLDRHLTESQAGELWEALQADDRACREAGRPKRSLLKLVGNPFMLLATVRIFEEHKKLPENRGQLSSAFGENLLERESRRLMGERTATAGTRKHAQRYLKPLARLLTPCSRRAKARVFRAKTRATLCPPNRHRRRQSPMP